MRRKVTIVLVLGLLGGVALVIGAGAGRGTCPMHAKQCAVAEECPLVKGECPKAACCEACPVKDECPMAGKAGCCEACPLSKNCPMAKPAARPAGCPMSGAAAPAAGCGMHAASGCGHAGGGAHEH